MYQQDVGGILSLKAQLPMGLSRKAARDWCKITGEWEKYDQMEKYFTAPARPKRKGFAKVIKRLKKK